MQISKITKCLIKPHYKQQNKCTVYHVKNSKKKSCMKLIRISKVYLLQYTVYGHFMNVKKIYEL